MPEPGIPQHLPSQMFTRYQLRQAATPGDPLYSLLESAAFESVFTVHDDFERGLDANIWTAVGFEWQEDNFFGSVANVSNLDEADPGVSDAVIYSRIPGWQVDRRAVVQTRFSISSVASGKVEVGFADRAAIEGSNLGIVPDNDSAVRRGDYGLTVWNPSESTTLIYVFARDGADLEAASSASGTPSVPIRVGETNPVSWNRNSERTNNIITATNENEEVVSYVNGQRVVSSRITGPRAGIGLAVWFYVGPNITTGAPIVNLDYIHAWQERIAL